MAMCDGGNWTTPLAGIVLPANFELPLEGIFIDADLAGALVGKSCRFFDVFKDETFDIQNIGFSNACFAPFVQFGKARFGHISFQHTWFNSANFVDAIFKGGVNFKEATFVGYADFAGAQFLGSVDITNVHFHSTARFDNAQFSGPARFEETEFAENARFEGVQFCGGLEFGHVRFCKRAAFVGRLCEPVGQKFSMTGPVELVGAPKPALGLHGLNDQGDTVRTSEEDRFVIRSADFSNACFLGDADFSDRHFVGPLKFGGAKFEGVVAFHNAELHENTTFPVSDGFSLPQRSLEGSCGWDQRCQDFEQAYRRLKLLMQEQGARTEEYAFYTLELKSRMRRGDVGFLEKVCAFFYLIFSDFGQSLFLPLLWLTIVVPGVIGAALWNMSKSAGLQESITNVSTYIVRNMMPWVSVHDLNSSHSFQSPYFLWIEKMVSAFGNWFHALTMLHVFINIILWFLLALALKRRFQLS
jgi:uncharacterized protein YjbI with pentapeptide repeats